MVDYKILYEGELKVGMSGSISKRITEEDVDMFAKVTGDYNPMHMDEEFAGKTQFHKRIAHGMLSAGMISACLGNKMPGPGAIYLNQTLKFDKPVYFGDVLVASVEVVKVDQKAHFQIVTLATTVTNQDGVVVTEGEAQIMPAKR
ncbi:MaoC family dehydratase [Companilactobacillus kimchiensis]|uniref:MaoC domain-containing protein dehydratase n=1 Tax=Companilactobacillus kimchiensis TaxID=993692 RepID=A0A0R2LFA2_9LACO|nr:MaoC family dehydratase [Companilactobacillus kimchiensis]KRN98124.1 MaoC domain-containing protein dehydratase [Companilactobacillus kimchiensis]